MCSRIDAGVATASTTLEVRSIPLAQHKGDKKWIDEDSPISCRATEFQTIRITADQAGRLHSNNLPKPRRGCPWIHSFGMEITACGEGASSHAVPDFPQGLVHRACLFLSQDRRRLLGGRELVIESSDRVLQLLL